MDENYNYRIIFVNDRAKHHRYISYDQVRKLVSKHFPKNLIAYRVVSNFPDLTISNVDHGFTILLNNENEIIFTDPVYAVKSIEEYLEGHPSIEFRFRVQKVGFTATNEVNDKTNFKEEFCFDMNIEEVVNQNDEKIVAPLLKKRIKATKKKKYKAENEKHKVFTPEKSSGEKYLPVSRLALNDKKTIDPEKFVKRTIRHAEGNIQYEDKTINLGIVERLYNEGMQLELSLSKGRRIDVKNFQVETASRNDQQSFRYSKRTFDDRMVAENNDQLRSKYSNEKVLEDVEFNKIKESTPIVIQKVGLEGESSESQPESIPETKQTDELFSGFLTSLQKESNVKSKKHRKRKETDILYLFKTLHAKDIKSNNKSDTNSG